MLLVFTEDEVPTWEARRKAKTGGGGRSDLVVGGTADTFEAAKAAALFEATAPVRRMTNPSKRRRHEKRPSVRNMETRIHRPPETIQQAIDFVSVSRVQLS